MKKKYVTMQLVVCNFCSNDVITSSVEQFDNIGRVDFWSYWSEWEE